LNLIWACNPSSSCSYFFKSEPIFSYFRSAELSRELEFFCYKPLGYAILVLKN
jgi:hypothetical protein